MSRLTLWNRTIDISASTTITFPSAKLLKYDSVGVFCESSQDAKIHLEHSIDNSNFDFAEYKYVHSGNNQVRFPLVAEWAKLKVENVGTSDASMRLFSYAYNDHGNTYHSAINEQVLDNVHLAAAGTTGTVQVEHIKDVDAYGSCIPATTLVIQYSPDDSTWHDSMHSISASGDFHAHLDVGARFMRFKNDGVDTSAIIVVSGKD